MVSFKNQQFSYHDCSDSKPYLHSTDFAFDASNALAEKYGMVFHNLIVDSFRSVPVHFRTPDRRC
jgi:hypothetical protein